MRSLNAVISALGLVAGLPAGALPARADASRMRNAAATYTSSLAGEKTTGLFAEVQIEPVPFFLASVEGKYRLVQVEVRNHSDKRIELDPAVDVFATTGVGGATGILDLAAADPTLWDGLEKPTRETLAYPKVLDKGETTTIFVFFPRDKLTSLPTGFKWAVASTGGTVELGRRMVKSKK